MEQIIYPCTVRAFKSELHVVYDEYRQYAIVIMHRLIRKDKNSHLTKEEAFNWCLDYQDLGLMELIKMGY